MPAKRLNIPKKILVDLYINKKLSTDAIANQLGCNHVTILNYLGLYRIPRRSRLGTRKPVNIDKATLFDLYHNQKLTHKEIALKFGHSRYGIQRRMKIYNISSRSLSEVFTKYPKYDFSNDLVEKAYLIGFRLGDLNVYKVHELIQARCSTTREAQVSLIQNLFKNYGNVHTWKAKRGTFEIVALLNKTFDFLLPKNDAIEDWILRNDKFFLSFLAGYSDAEGSFYVRTNGIRKPFAGFQLTTYDKNIIRTIGTKLKSLGLVFPDPCISSRAGIDYRGVRRNKDSWRVSIHRKAALYQLTLMLKPYVKHTSKIEAITKVRNNILSRNNP